MQLFLIGGLAIAVGGDLPADDTQFADRHLSAQPGWRSSPGAAARCLTGAPSATGYSRADAPSASR